MNKSNEMEAEIQALRERLSRLSAAVLRISSSLDLYTVLREVVESGRALTGARYGVITTIDKAGQLQDLVTSGITPEEHRQLEAWPDGIRLFEHLRDLPGAIRLRDLPAYVRSLGFSSDLMRWKTMQGTPMRHRGMHVGTFFLAEKEGGPEFTDEDEEVLVLFASQAATAIANARTHQDEQRARSNLEALVDTSPVGVVVFDPRIGHPVSLNREAKRIVSGLRMPDRTPEQLLEVLTYRRADGREIALADFPLALAQELMSNTELVRAEEKPNGVFELSNPSLIPLEISVSARFGYTEATEHGREVVVEDSSGSHLGDLSQVVDIHPGVLVLMPGEKGLVRYGLQEGALAAMAEKGYAAFFDVVSEPRQYVRSDQMPEEVTGDRTARVTMRVPGVYVPGEGASQLRATLSSISYVGSLSATFLLETQDHPFVGEVLAYDGEGRELGRRETLVYTRSRVRIPLDRMPEEGTVFLRFSPRGSGRVPDPASVEWDAPRRDIGAAEDKDRATTTATLVQKP